LLKYGAKVRWVCCSISSQRGLINRLDAKNNFLTLGCDENTFSTSPRTSQFTPTYRPPSETSIQACRGCRKFWRLHDTKKSLFNTRTDGLCFGPCENSAKPSPSMPPLD
jgi:hypothetical protein